MLGHDERNNNQKPKQTVFDQEILLVEPIALSFDWPRVVSSKSINYLPGK